MPWQPVRSTRLVKQAVRQAGVLLGGRDPQLPGQARQEGVRLGQRQVQSLRGARELGARHHHQSSSLHLLSVEPAGGS